MNEEMKVKENQAAAPLNEEATEATKPEEAKEAPETDVREMFRARAEEIRKKQQAANEIMGQGKGRLRLEKPIKAGDKDIEELVYDFTELTGMEYTDAMDTDPTANQIYRITYRQGLALFAKAAAKQTEGVDMEDIISRIGVTDAVAGSQLATLFFSASTRAGRLRLSKK